MRKNIIFKISIVLNIILCVALAAAIIYTSTNNSIQAAYKVQYEERTSLFDRVPTAHADVVFLGDSITQNGLWEELFPDVSLVNRGIRGDITEGILKRLDDVIKLHPKKVFLMAGVNDLERKENQEDILNNYKKIISVLRSDLPDTTIYIQSVLPVRENLKGIKNENIDRLNQQLIQLTDGNKIIYIDINSKLKTKDNELNPNYTVDGEHLKGVAYTIWADEIRSYVSGS